MQKSRLMSAAVRSIWGFGSPKLALLCRGCCYWRVISQTLFMLQSWAFQKCFRHLHNFIQGHLSSMPQTSPQFRDRLLLLLQIQPSQHGTQKTNNLNFFVTFEIPSDAGRFAQSSPERCNGICRRCMSIWSRNWEQGSVPEASQAVLCACVRKLNRATLATATRFPVIKIGFRAWSSTQTPAWKNVSLKLNASF